MHKWATLLLFLAVLGLLARGQDIVPPTVVAPVAMGTPLPSSIRVIAPLSYFTDANPVAEGEFGLPTDDQNHILVWHNNHWRFITLNTSIAP